MSCNASRTVRPLRGLPRLRKCLTGLLNLLLCTLHPAHHLPLGGRTGPQSVATSAYHATLKTQADSPSLHCSRTSSCGARSGLFGLQALAAQLGSPGLSPLQLSRVSELPCGTSVNYAQVSLKTGSPPLRSSNPAITTISSTKAGPRYTRIRIERQHGELTTSEADAMFKNITSNKSVA